MKRKRLTLPVADGWIADAAKLLVACAESDGRFRTIIQRTTRDATGIWYEVGLRDDVMLWRQYVSFVGGHATQRRTVLAAREQERAATLLVDWLFPEKPEAT